MSTNSPINWIARALRSIGTDRGIVRFFLLPKQRKNRRDSGKKTVRERPTSLKGWTYRMQTGCGPLYVTINEDEDGLFELFTTMGKAGGCAASQSEAIGRMVSLAWRSGVQPDPGHQAAPGYFLPFPFGLR